MLHLTPSRLVVKSGVLLEVNCEDASIDVQQFGINTVCPARCQNKLCHQIMIMACDTGCLSKLKPFDVRNAQSKLK
jgi:hypothetical protein